MYSQQYGAPRPAECEQLKVRSLHRGKELRVKGENQKCVIFYDWDVTHCVVLKSSIVWYIVFLRNVGTYRLQCVIQQKTATDTSILLKWILVTWFVIILTQPSKDRVRLWGVRGDQKWRNYQQLHDCRLVSGRLGGNVNFYWTVDVR